MKKIKKLSTILIYIIFIALLLSIILIKYFSYKIKPGLNKYVVSEVERIITLIINDSVSQELNRINSNSILNRESNNEKVSLYNINMIEINKIQNNINKKIQKNIKMVSMGKINKIDKYFSSMSDIDYENLCDGVVYYISSGNLSGSIFTNNLGPKIPIKFLLDGSVISKINSRVVEYGINNAILEIKIAIRVSIVVNMPYVTKKVTVKTSNIIFNEIIQGEIPEYYFKDKKIN